MNIIEWIQNWYKNECNGDWEHQYGISISNTDNPGWLVTIDLAETALEGLSLEYILQEESENSWFGISIKDNIFKGVGDPDKLNLLLEKFKELVEQGSIPEDW